MFKYLLINGGLVVSLYFGMVSGITGAMNVGLFILWVTIIISGFLLIEDVRKEENVVTALQNLPVPRSIDRIFDIGIVLSLVWYGWIITGIGYFIHMIIIHYVFEEVNGSP